MTRLSVLLLLLVLSACSRPAEPTAAAPAANTTTPVAVTKMPSFDAARMLADIKTLSSDEFEGRAPGSKGEELTVKFLEDQMACQDFDALKKQALTREFRPVPRGLQASVAIRNTLRTIQSQNVLAKLEGSDPQLRNEYVVYTAHWDHLGVGAPVNGDKIYNGALDNASGVSQVLEIARLHGGRAAAEAVDRVSDGRRRGAGPAWRAALR